MVAVIWILDTFHTVLICHKMHTYLIMKFGDYDALAHIDKSPVNLALMVVILALALVQLAFGLGLTFSLTEYVQFLNYTWAVDTWLGSAAACDLMVSVALVRSLVMKRSTIKRTRTLIDKLVRRMVAIGMLTR
ncbi:hypothetical protein CALVIDRAFT_568315 [Calocera viscosa TUFC12733]|uniref:Uncharacterized protein n=1 Tax=Calocera viscosa (strain TUFC12733) TaxID=1330018 RepID=A0A167HA47_CALVF|nr:hypothetical protein CALVIDRAFT_568315 [Calocera viscosa TUFC12733]